MVFEKKIEKKFLKQQILIIKWSNDQNFKVYVLLNNALSKTGNCIIMVPKISGQETCLSN